MDYNIVIDAWLTIWTLLWLLSTGLQYCYGPVVKHIKFNIVMNLWLKILTINCYGPMIDHMDYNMVMLVTYLTNGFKSHQVHKFCFCV